MGRTKKPPSKQSFDFVTATDRDHAGSQRPHTTASGYDSVSPPLQSASQRSPLQQQEQQQTWLQQPWQQQQHTGPVPAPRYGKGQQPHQHQPQQNTQRSSRWQDEHNDSGDDDQDDEEAEHNSYRSQASSNSSDCNSATGSRHSSLWEQSTTPSPQGEVRALPGNTSRSLFQPDQSCTEAATHHANLWQASQAASAPVLESSIRPSADNTHQLYDKGSSGDGPAVVVSAIDGELPDMEYLEMYFEKAKRSGGGEIANATLLQDGSMLFTFLDGGVVERLCARQHKVGGTALSVRQYVAEPEPGPALSILVSNLPPKCNDDYLEMYFDSKKRSGGEGVQSVEMLEGSDEAVVTFESAEVAAAVCARSHELFKRPVQVELLQGGRRQEATGDPCLTVTNIPSRVVEDELEMYFESAKRSGGDYIAQLVYNSAEGVASIVFESPLTMERVAGRTHSMRGCLLNVSVGAMSVGKPSTQSAHVSSSMPGNPAQYELKKILLVNIPPEADEHLIRYFMLAVPKLQGGVSITAYPENSRALVTFERPMDFDRVKAYVTREKLHGHDVAARRVLRSHRLRVRNADELGDCAETLKYMLKAEVQLDVKVDTSCGSMDVVFPSSHDAERVLSGTYKLAKKVLDMHPVVAGLDYPAEEDDPSGFTMDSSATQSVELPIAQDYLLLLQKCPAVRRELESVLQKVHAEVESLDVSSACLVINATDGKSGMFGWQKRASIQAQDFLKGLSTSRIGMLSDMFEDIVKGSGRLLQALTRFQKDVLVRSYADDNTVLITGRRDSVEAALQVANEMIAEIEKTLKEQVTEAIKLRPVVSTFFQRRNTLPQMLEKTKHVEVSFPSSGKDKGAIVLAGPRHLVAELTQKLMNLQQQVFEKQLALSEPAIAILLASSRGQEYMEEVLKAEDLEAIAYVATAKGKPPMISIVGWMNREQDLLGLKSGLEDGCLSEAVQLQPHEVEALAKQPWKQLVANIEGSSLVKVAVGPVHEGCVVLHGIDLDIASARALISDHMLAHAILAASIPISRGHERLIQEHYRPKIGEIKQTCSLPNVDINNSVISFRGNTQSVKGAKIAFANLVKSIITDKLSIDRPGMHHVFSRTEMKAALKRIEKELKVVIVSGDVSLDPGMDAAAVGAGELLLTVTLGNGVEVKVMKSDITKHQCDAVVNAANDRLEHIGGVAAALASAGGRIIQDECRQYVAKNGQVRAGCVVCTSAGTLPCKVLIHAVGPRYSDGRKGEQMLLGAAVRNSLQEAVKHKLTSIALPAISTGVFGYPLDLAAETILQTAVQFLNEGDSTLREVHFVDLDQKVVDTFKNLIVRYFPSDQIRLAGSEAGGSVRVSLPTMSLKQAAAQGKAGSAKSRAHKGKKGKHQLAWAPGPGKPAFQPPPSGISQVDTAEQKKITARHGDLCKEQADVIVISTASSLTLKNGMASLALLRAAGQGLQTECTNYVQTNGDVTIGDIASTSGYSLSCQQVYHCVANSYNNGTGSQCLHDIVTKCLEEANRQGHKSIVFPSLGTGNLGFPAAESARLMFAAALEFSRCNPTGSINDIRFAVFDPNILLEFHAEAAKHIITVPTEGLQQVQEMPPNEIAPVVASQPSAASATAQPSSPVFIHKDGDILCGVAGNSSLQLCLFKGDITKETGSDAVVVTVNDKLDMMAGNVSRKIATTVGGSCQAECKTTIRNSGGSLPPGAVAVISGGDFAKCLLLAVCPSNSAGVDALADIVSRALVEADKFQATTVSFPAMGTGILGFRHDASAEAMFSAISEFAPNARHVNQVRLVLFDNASMEPFQREFNDTFFNITLAHDSSGDGYLSRVGRFIGVSSGSNPKAPDMTGASVENVIRKSEGPVVLHLFGVSREGVKKTKTEINALCNEKYRTAAVEHGGVKHMDQNAQQSLLAAMDRFSVEVKISKGKITISGDTLHVAEARGTVLEYASNAMAQHQQLKHAERTAQCVLWKFTPAGSSVEKAYDTLVNASIEDQFQDYKGKRGRALAKIAGPVRRVVDFSTMKESVNGKLVADVVRVDLTKKEITPSHWDPSKGQLVQLSTTDAEYQQAEQLFRKSCQRQIVKIERVQNPGLYSQYQAKKAAMDKSSSTNKSNEGQLFHGTDNVTVQKVLVQGFNRSFAGKNATAYGKGVYFAVNAQYSSNYATGNPPLQMFMCMVLTGDYTAGNSSMLAPPARSGVELYDTTVDNVGNPTIFVTYHDAQVYPAFLITFQ